MQLNDNNEYNLVTINDELKQGLTALKNENLIMK